MATDKPRTFIIAALSLGIAALLLITTAALHFTGLPLARALADIDTVPPLLRLAGETLWLFPTVHWVAIAIAAILIFRRADSRIILSLLGAMLIIDGAMLYADLGPFIGAITLLMSGTLMIAAGWLRQKA